MTKVFPEASNISLPTQAPEPTPASSSSSSSSSSTTSTSSSASSAPVSGYFFAALKAEAYDFYLLS
jgi:hypothetical protein